jgi:hypothetical protein
MKPMRLLIGFVLMVTAFTLSAQTTGLNYQAVIRNAALQPIASQSGVATISILDPASVEIYREIQTINTDALGLFNLVVGKGTALNGNFATLDWGSGGRSLKVNVSIGGNNYDFSPSELQAVPYAKIAEKTLQGDGDSDPNNEIQQLSINGGTISLSNGGGSINLPPNSGTDSQTLSLSGNNLSISNGNSVSLPAEVDGSVTNEIQQISLSGNTISLSNGGGNITLPQLTDNDAQTLSVSGNTMSISNGNTVTLPAEVDGSVTNEIQQLSIAGNTISLSNGGGNITLPATTDNDAQTLSVNGNTLSISNGNAVTLPTGTVYTAGQGISINGANVITNTGDLNAADDITNSTAAGGDLVGFYPTPQIANNAINSAKIADGSIIAADLVPGIIPQSLNDLNDVTTSGASNGQVLKWNGAQWIPQDDNTSSGSGNTATLAPLSGNGSSGSPVTIGQNGAANGQVLKWNGVSWAPANDNGVVYSAGQGIVINGTDISATDNSATNELQNLSIAGNQLSISNGNSVNLPAESQTLALSGNQLSISNGNSVNLPAESQTLSINGNQLSISNGNSVGLPAEVDGSITNEIQALSLAGNQLSLSLGGGSVTLPAETDGSVTNEIQTLSLSGNQLSLSLGGGSVTLEAGTTYTAGAGISIAGSTITNTGDTDASNDITTTSTAGGDITGTFPNLQLAANSVGTNEITNGSITAADLAPGVLGNSNWAANGNNIYNTNTGNVGIGTNAPTGKLEILGTSNLTDGISIIGSFANGIHCDPENANAAFAAHPIGENVKGIELSTDKGLAIDATTTGINAPVAILNKSNSLNYAANLILKGNAPTLELQNDFTSQSSKIHFTEPLVGGDQSSEWFITANPDQNTGFMAFDYFHSNNLFLSYSNPLYLTSKGQVGINATNPQAGLDVKPRSNSDINLLLSPASGDQFSKMAMRTYENGSSFDQFNFDAFRNNGSDPSLFLTYQSTSPNLSSLTALLNIRPYNPLLAELNGSFKCYNFLNMSNLAYLTQLNVSGGSFGIIQTRDPFSNPLGQITTLSGSNSKGYISVFSSGVNKAGMFVNVSNQGVLFADVKNFRMDDPRDKDKEIWYACVEGPEAAAYERGTATLRKGTAEIKFSDHFEIVANPKTMTVIITPLSADSKGLAVVEKTATGFKVKEMFQGTGDYEFDWEVKCVRKGYEDYKVVRSKAENMPSLPNIRD